MKEIFSEYEESKDERIRKSLSAFFAKFDPDDMWDADFSFGDIVAWFKKQDEPIDKIVKRAMTEKQRVLLTETSGDANIDWDTRSLQDVKLLLEYGLDYIKKLEKQSEQKSAEWEPQTGDTFRKKGTTSPTYHLCDKREDGITFGFVENREVGISGGEITIFALKQDYELVERPKSIEDVVEEELNKDLQTKVEQKLEWSEEDEKTLDDVITNYESGYLPSIDKRDEIVKKLESLKDRIQLHNTWKPGDLPHWKKGSLPNDDTTGFNSDYFCHKGYCINYKELFEKLPKDD